MKLFYPIPYYDLFFITFSYQHGMEDERGEILGDERGEIWEAARKAVRYAADDASNGII